MAKSFCRLLIQVNQAYVAIFNVANMSFNAIREIKILAKISEFTILLKLMYDEDKYLLLL